LSLSQLSFLLPPDHGLDPINTSMQLLDAVSMQPLVSHPVPLASLTMAPCRQQAPARLAAGLRRLLQEVANGAGSSTASTAGLQLSSGLHLRGLAEHADRFEAELAVDPSLGGALSSSGLELQFPGAPFGGGECQQLKVGEVAGVGVGIGGVTAWAWGCCCHWQGVLGLQLMALWVSTPAVHSARDDDTLRLPLHAPLPKACLHCHGHPIQLPACTPLPHSLLQLTMAQPARLEACITFPWPVDSAAANLRVSRRQAVGWW